MSNVAHIAPTPVAPALIAAWRASQDALDAANKSSHDAAMALAKAVDPAVIDAMIGAGWPVEDLWPQDLCEDFSRGYAFIVTEGDALAIKTGGGWLRDDHVFLCRIDKDGSIHGGVSS